VTIKILIVDDHGVLRAGLRALLNSEANMEVVGEAENGEQAITQAAKLSPDVILMDISMPGISGIEATRHLMIRHPRLRVLLLTIHEDKTLLQEAIKNGAAGYILKRAVESELINAIRAVAAGDMYIHPAMTRALFSETSKPHTGFNSIMALTEREIEVLQFIAQGYTNRQIANLLHISVRTVETHRANLMGKLDLSSRVELVRFAANNGLINSQ